MAVTPEEIFLHEILTHKGIVMRICKIYRKDKDDQDDLYQEIILNAWQSFPRFEGKSKFSTWLYRVALNTALHQNRKNRFLGKIIGLDDAMHLHDDDVNNNDGRIKMLYDAIYQLEPIEKSIVMLYLDELPYKEISEITGLTESNVGVRLNRAKIKMRKIFTAYGF